jgi:hypothetical protein
MKTWIQVCALIISTCSVFCQSTDAWQKKHALRNRYEGLIDVPVSNPALEVLSFTSYLQPFVGNEEWRVRFYSPKQTTATVYARDIDSQVQYWMESVPWPSFRWSEFSGWATGDVLVPLKLKPTDIGVTVIEAGSGDLYLPALVYPTRSGPPRRRIDAYILRLRANRTITRIEWEVSGQPTTKPYRKSVASIHSAGDPFHLELEMNGIDAGQLILTVKVFNGELAVLSRQLNFYHQPQPD